MRSGSVSALPVALASPCGVAPALGGSGPHGLDGIGSCSELMRGNMGDDSGLAGGERGVSGSPSQGPGGTHGVTTRGARLHHRELPSRPSAHTLDGLSRSRVRRLSRLEDVEDVLRTRCGPQSQKAVFSIGQAAAAADSHQPKVY